jgi:CheY-like chemotaxis protein
MPTVLLVDDSPVARRAVSARLSSQGFEVREASSAQAARALDLSSLTCAVLDLQLSDGDGTDLAASLLSRRPGLPLAFFTAGAIPSLVESARCRGPVFLKPDVGPLLSWITRLARPSPSQPPPTK